MRRVAVTLAALLLVAGCASAEPAGTPGPSGALPGSPSAPPIATPAVATATPSPDPTAPPPASPSPTALPTPTPVPTPPTADAFWAAVAAGIKREGHLRIRVIGPSPGVLRYEPTASATVINGQISFVCVGGKAYDGQSGFDRVEGTWTCGASALVEGFRGAGLPRDAWNDTLPPDDEIREVVTRLDDGTWQWSYRALNPVFGGEIRARVVADPANGEIRSASRTDPFGETTYGISYTETFPKIAVP